MAMINYALPGTIVGIAYLIAFNDPPIALTGRALIIIACYVFRYGRPASAPRSRCCSRSTTAWRKPRRASARAAADVPPHHAAAGAPAFFAGVGVVFIRSMTAISATIFLVSIGWTLITVRILENMTELSLGPAAAFSVFVIVIVFVMAVSACVNALLRRCRPRAAAAALGRRRRLTDGIRLDGSRRASAIR